MELEKVVTTSFLCTTSSKEAMKWKDQRVESRRGRGAVEDQG
jgi:hypothetical protein